MIKNNRSIYYTWLVLILLPLVTKSQAIFKDEPIFPFQDKHVHSSSIVECPNGDLLVCWFHGSGERTADDVLIQGSRLKKDATTWESVFLMADTPGFPDCNPVLFIDQKEQLWLFWIVVQAHRWEQSILKYRTATDYFSAGSPKWAWQEIIQLKPGKAFAEAVKDGYDKWAEESMWAEYAPPYTEMIIEAAKDPAKRQIGWMTRTHPITLPGGRILLPLYSDGYCLSLTAISDDGGKNWRAGLPMVGLGLNQPCIVRKKNGTLVAFMRDEGNLPMRVPMSVSEDDGQSWSYAVDTDIPNPSTSLEVIALQNGNWVMAFNDTEEGRHSLAAALSEDEGKTWKWKKHIELDKKGKGSFSYPSLIQTRDGMLHVTYSYRVGEKNRTIKHSQFNEEWIKE